MKFKFIIFLLSSFVISGGKSQTDHNPTDDPAHSGEHHDEGSIDGEYIMHHIQDGAVFEIFNPLDYNDANGDHYYFTKKINLDSDWNRFLNIPIIGNMLNWKWDPSKSLSPSENSDQLMISKQLIMMLIAVAIIILSLDSN